MKSEKAAKKLTWRKVREMRRLHALGVRYSTLAHDFDVSESTVWNVVKCRTWQEER